MSKYTTGEAAKLCGVTVRTVQYYDTRGILIPSELSEGGKNLSGGQRQKIHLARALYKNPAILILDEATSAIDAESEKRIMDNLRRRSCTCITVAHRLSTIRNSDLILVMDRGRIVQSGTHEMLMNQDGLYRKLLSQA